METSRAERLQIKGVTERILCKEPPPKEVFFQVHLLRHTQAIKAVLEKDIFKWLLNLIE